MTWSDRCFCRCRHESGNLARSHRRREDQLLGATGVQLVDATRIASWSNKPIKKLVAHRRFGERRIRRRGLKRDRGSPRVFNELIDRQHCSAGRPRQ